MRLFSFLFSSDNKNTEKQDTKKEAKKREWKDTNEQYKFVCEAGKVKCQYCSAPLSPIKVTSNDVSLQDVPYMTTADNNGKVNLNFTGDCLHPKAPKANGKPLPCKMLINLLQWQNPSETFINNDLALIVDSRIKCIVSNSDLTIEHSGQKAFISELEPKATPQKPAPPGYFYSQDGIFLGKISHSENVYLTNKDNFEKMKKKEPYNEADVIAFTEEYNFKNKELLDRANWVYGEGGGVFAERYAMTIKNLRNSGRSGYGPTPFSSEEAMYKATMTHGVPAKLLYPGYFNGTEGGAPAKVFAKARKSTDYSDLMKNTKMVSSIKAVIDSIMGISSNEGYNNWRGSGDTLYTQAEKAAYEKNYKQPKDSPLKRKDTGKTYANIKTHVDHYWEPVGSKYRRHSFYKITKQ